MDASRARASDAPVVDRAFARADIVERPPRASSRLLLVVVVARPSSADVDRVLARALASRGTNERTNDERRRRRSNDRSNARDPPDIIFLRASTARATRHSRRRARPRGIHPSIHSRAIGPWRGSNRIEIGRTFCSLVVSAARATTTRPARRLEFAVALTARVSRACVIARVVANIVGVCRPRARDGQRRARDGRDRDFDRWSYGRVHYVGGCAVYA